MSHNGVKCDCINVLVERFLRYVRRSAYLIYIVTQLIVAKFFYYLMFDKYLVGN